ncbi:ABC transporter ATP-binding protein [Phytohabitans suffuscus]|uniref:Dipeptide/oligopeptide/nickel ABC transporter ATP-binding protein n=1 Tax=Phytohabitans suffuscus TaxID=624315 RepID=A0A6F8Z0A5_9ACTN|nr:ABC transporter ATP-binding protein [Phytohabitans suffuscus]BCB91865.1 dipeptide/oligopeptide/nickel ABC transporter ATP-binding protein [Phytohabitans suffuscus]
MSTMEPVLTVDGLRTHLFTRWGTTRAVDGVSFTLHRGETLGIVGESGSGKSMLALSLVRLTPEPAARILAGSVVLDGTDLLTLSEKRMRKLRGSAISMILQDPHQSLNPVFTVGNQLAEAVHVHRPELAAAAVRERVLDGLRKVRMPAPERRLRDYPHELSGGMKQRIVGAMAISADPRVLIADEPTTALDVTTQQRYLRLLREIQRETGVAIILITHDFGVVAEACDRVAVMYAGRIVEQGPVREIFDRPRHPYTRALLDSRPRRDVRLDRLPSIEGSPPSLVDPPPGCRFAPRCRLAAERCTAEYPELTAVAPGHETACWRWEEVS